MHDNWLIAIAMAISGLGMVGLLFALIFLELPESGIAQAKASADGVPLRLRGEVVSVRQTGNITTVSVSQSEAIDVVVFETVDVREGTCVVVQGKRSSYEGKAQITATRVSVC